MCDRSLSNSKTTQKVLLKTSGLCWGSLRSPAYCARIQNYTEIPNWSGGLATLGHPFPAVLREKIGEKKFSPKIFKQNFDIFFRKKGFEHFVNKKSDFLSILRK